MKQAHNQEQMLCSANQVVQICKLPLQRRHQHFKSGQATANKRSLVHVHGGRSITGNVQATCGIKMQLYKKHLNKNKYNSELSKNLETEKQDYCKQQNASYH